jgi:Fe-S cluster assembly protein SufD
MNAEVRPIKTAAETALAASFAEARRRLPGVADLREAAFQRFEAGGLPHRRVEAWKYTDLRALMREARPLAELPDAAALARARGAGAGLASVESRRIVFVDGAFVPELSDLADIEQGLAICSLAVELANGVGLTIGRIVPTEDIAVALNTAFMRDGAVIEIAEGAALARPLHLIFFNSGSSPASVYTHSLVRVGRGARAMIIESHEGAAGSDNHVNTALELKVGDKAHVDHIKITGEGSGSIHLSTLMASIGAKARFNEFLFTSASALVRNQLFIRFGGEDTVAGIRGASLLRGQQHTDTTLVAEHAASGCVSRQVFKSVVDDAAQSIFQGKIIVQPQAQKTDAKMATHALLLSPEAEADSKPELEIYADDVQCGHGATIGALDEDLLFYLKARGIPTKEAEALMIEAFVGEAIEGIEHAGLRDTLVEQVAAWLKTRGL